ncbi:MAG: carbohydrate binding family 9 domain-containing protein [Alphaproteobacteria bacterium]
MAQVACGRGASRAPKSFWALVFAACLPVGAAAQPSGIDFNTYRPTTQAVRVEHAEAPKIDGDLSDAAWEKAKPIDAFYQIEPKGGETASERTVVRILYDREALYFSFYCYDSQPDKIPLGAKTRDTNVQNGDFIRVYLDPTMSRRNGYTFEVNAVGGRADSLLNNNGEPLYEWNTLWAAKTKRVAGGWTVEIMVPFRSISYDAKRADWGLDLYRRMYRISERVRWTSAASNIDTFDITREGTMTGVSNISQGLGLDIKTYAALRYKHEWEQPREDDLKLAESGLLAYKITPSLTGTLTLNPDFSNTPLDERRINTGQYALFFPETRDFFLQDASAFEFGGMPFNRNGGGDSNGLPFFSRNIGLVQGVQTPIRFGGKLSGEVAGWNVGGFSALTDGLGVQNRQWLSVARVSHAILAESKIGMIVTNGDPTGDTNNTVFGTDFQYRNSHVAGDKVLMLTGSFLRSRSDVSGTPKNDEEFVLSAQFPNEPWYGRLIYKQIGSDFTPALGFVNQVGVRDYRSVLGRLKRVDHPWIQWWEMGYFQHLTTDIDNKLIGYAGSVYLGGQNRAGDGLWLNLNREVQVVPAPFNLGGSATVSAGTHRFNYFDLNGNFSAKRSWYGWYEIVCCDFYDGRAFQVYSGLTFKLNDTWEIAPGYAGVYADLPSGSASIHAPSLQINVNFTPDMTIRSQAQYDNLSHSFSLAVRYQWEYSPGQEFFAAFGENALIDRRIWHSHYASQTTQASIRLGQTFRF